MRSIKRIQRNACPSDTYNDGSAVIPTGPERSDAASNAVSSSDTNVNASTVTPREPERSGSTANAVMRRCGLRTGVAHGRMLMER